MGSLSLLLEIKITFLFMLSMIMTTTIKLINKIRCLFLNLFLKNIEKVWNSNYHFTLKMLWYCLIFVLLKIISKRKKILNLRNNLIFLINPIFKNMILMTLNIFHNVCSIVSKTWKFVLKISIKLTWKT